MIIHAKPMDRLRTFIENDIFILAVMSIFTYLKQMIREEGRIKWRMGFIKVFLNFVAGWGFYSFLLSYRAWYGEYPQKVGVIMVVVYGGTKMIDLIVDAIYRVNLKEMIKRWMGL